MHQKLKLRCTAVLRYRGSALYVTNSVNLSGLARRSPDPRGSSREGGGKDPWKKQSNLAISSKWQDSVSIMFENWFFCCSGELYVIAVTSFVLLQTIRWARFCSVPRPSLVLSWGLGSFFACLVYMLNDTFDSNVFSNQHLWHDQRQLRCT